MVTASVSSRTESKVCNCVASFSSSDKPTSHFITTGNSKRVLGETKMNMQKKNKLVKPAVKLEPSTNGVYEETADRGMSTLLPHERLRMCRHRDSGKAAHLSNKGAKGRRCPEALMPAKASQEGIPGDSL